MDQKEGKKVVLRCSDGKLFEFAANQIVCSRLLTVLTETGEPVIDVEYNSAVLAHVQVFTDYQCQLPAKHRHWTLPRPIPTPHLVELVPDAIKNYCRELEHSIQRHGVQFLLQLIISVHAFDIPQLEQLLCAQLAVLIKDRPDTDPVVQQMTVLARKK